MSVEELTKFIVVYIAGIVSSVAVFRTRFQRIDDRFVFEKEARATERAHDKEVLDLTLGAMRKNIARTTRTVARMERRQLATQEITADIARKLGVTHRALGDAITRADDAERDIDDGE